MNTEHQLKLKVTWPNKCPNKNRTGAMTTAKNAVFIGSKFWKLLFSGGVNWLLVGG